eukprot:835913-Rhodomonas_salina.3
MVEDGLWQSPQGKAIKKDLPREDVDRKHVPLVPRIEADRAVHILQRAIPDVERSPGKFVRCILNHPFHGVCENRALFFNGVENARHIRAEDVSCECQQTIDLLVATLVFARVEHVAVLNLDHQLDDPSCIGSFQLRTVAERQDRVQVHQFALPAQRRRARGRRRVLLDFRFEQTRSLLAELGTDPRNLSKW